MGKAIIIGGSMSGLLTGLSLRRAGWEVDIFERAAEPLDGRGAGIVTHDDLVCAIREAGVDIEAADLGVRVERRCVLTRTGAVEHEIRMPQVLTSWDRLYTLLRGAFPEDRYHRGKALNRVEEIGASVRALFADATSAEGDLLIGADGFRSTVRQQMLPDVGPLYAGYIAWRGLVDEAALSPTTHAAIFDNFAFALPEGEQILGYPVAGRGNDLRPGHRRYNIVWYRPAAQETTLRDMLTDAEGRFHAVSIAPFSIRPDVVSAMRRDAEAVLAPAFAELIALNEAPFFQPIYDLETPRMAFGRTVILGDAAFVARPHVGAGVTKAAGDAVALRRALESARDLSEALLRFDAERRHIGARIIAHARHLGAYLQAAHGTEDERRAAQRHRRPEAVLTETANLEFLEVRAASPTTGNE